MEIDAMQYASISRELLRGDNFLHLFDNGHPYLDKPPLIFWITALFFKLFGPSDFVYRLPSILFTLILIYSTYRFARLYYSEKISQVAAIILASSEAIFIMNSDVRTDIYMIAPMMTAIWQLSTYFHFHRLKNLIVGCVAIALAMMGKGPLGLVIPLSVLIVNLIFNGKIRYLLDKQILIGVAVFFLCLFPMSYGLYTQFGFHGLKFFYWTQSFGRVTGESSWSNATGPFYLFNVFLYGFLPWTMISLVAIIDRLIDIIKNKYDNSKTEVISLFGFILPLLMLSASHYKLPHYIYCVMPFASVLTAVKIDQWIQSNGYYKILYMIQAALIGLMLILVYGVSFYAFGININMIIISLILILIVKYMTTRKPKSKTLSLLIPSITVSVLCNYGFNLGIMKPLLEFQSQSEVAAFIKENNYESYELYLYNEDPKDKSRSFNFYLNRNIQYIDSSYIKDTFHPNSELVFTNEEGLKELLDKDIDFMIIKKFDHVRVSKLKTSFIDPKTRSTVIRKKYLLRFV